MEQVLTFDKLPEAVTMLIKEVSELKRLYFSRTELLEYLKDGRKKSNAEIEQEAKAYLSNNKKGLNNGK